MDWAERATLLAFVERQQLSARGDEVSRAVAPDVVGSGRSLLEDAADAQVGTGRAGVRRAAVCC